MSLQAIMDYWSGTADDYATRVNNLLSGNGVPLLNTLGAALYRAGDFPGARKQLGEAIKVNRPKENIWDQLLLAMTCHPLGQSEEARRRLDQAARILDGFAVDRPLAGAPALLNWAERLELRLLREEATALLRPKP